MFTIQATTGGAILTLPNPDKDSAKGIIATMVNSGRNTLGVLTAQKIGRDQDKTEMKWNYLEKDEWEALVGFWDANFTFNLTYYSSVAKAKITRVFYIGDRNSRPFDVDANGIPTAYQDCTANVIDTGVTA